MRLSSSSPWAFSAFAACTLALQPSIYLSDSSRSASPQVLSPVATRLLLARRLGVSRYHSLEGAEESTLRILNDFGGEHKPLLFAEEDRSDRQNNLIVIEDVENPNDILDNDINKAAFTMDRAPQSSETRRLINDLLKQAQQNSIEQQRSGTYSQPDCSPADGGVITGSTATGICPPAPVREGKSDNSLYWPSFLKDLSSPSIYKTAIIRIPLSDITSANDLKNMKKSLSKLLHPSSNSETTLILMPPSSSKSKRSSGSVYGSYAMPNLHAREGQSEAPLTGPSAPKTSLPSHHVSTPQALKASSVSRPGILPVCQPNLEKLVEVTNNCSGHGTPYLKRNTSSEDTSACYACKCGKTVLDRGEGKGVKTIEWAGPACAKKDVSTSFWLLAGISIAMIATVSWGVGLLFSIGQEELPSVIGAGVAGPRAQK
ncbi:MAG: hypothetical protein Q9222_003234 [Ikaeria aurantiellina]